MIGGLKTAGDLWLLEPDVNALGESLLRVFHNREVARDTGKRAREKVIDGWTWKHSAEKALERVRVLKRLPPLRHVRTADAAVLIDLQDEAAVSAVTESLKSTSYASLEVFTRSGSFASLLNHVVSSVRAPYLIVVTEPLRFSKHWFNQLSAIARGAGQGPRLIAPRIDNAEPGERDEQDFQRFARMQWRQHRGAYTPSQSVPTGCVLLNWECLTSPCDTSTEDAAAWIAQRVEDGARVFVAEDTWLGRINASPHNVEKRETSNVC
jgi:hypothetical protein